MYCKHCGKELSDEAMMCPNCGTPTGNGSVRRPERNAGTTQKRACAITGFTLALISFVATIVLVTIGMISGRTGSETITALSGIAGLIFSIFGMYEAKKSGDGIGRGLAIAGIVFAAVALFYYFIITAIFSSFPYDYYYDYYY